MTYSISTHSDVQVLSISNLLNETDNRAILSDVQSRIEQGFKKMVIDLSQLNFMNSVGLNFLILMLSKSKDSGGELAVVNPSEQVIKLLEITKLRSQFRLLPSLETALSRFAVN